MGGGGGGVIHPPSIKACNRKTNKIKPIEIIKRNPKKEKERGGCRWREGELRGREYQKGRKLLEISSWEEEKKKEKRKKEKKGNKERKGKEKGRRRREEEEGNQTSIILWSDSDRLGMKLHYKK